MASLLLHHQTMFVFLFIVVLLTLTFLLIGFHIVTIVGPREDFIYSYLK